MLPNFPKALPTFPREPSSLVVETTDRGATRGGEEVSSSRLPKLISSTRAISWLVKALTGRGRGQEDALVF
ncbi:hypothetical protein H5410_004081 [Solanum commersonii]|uniref:Uncharacterized protein n=1 Tax=Solanum commersonii TaxID=4109 RepID=A0A9J6B730_SOLCO|nr:hypothetical protein H5410_004081 [Solanum commersonii]